MYAASRPPSGADGSQGARRAHPPDPLPQRCPSPGHGWRADPVHIWDVLHLDEPPLELRGHDGRALQAAVSADGGRIVVKGSWSPRVWDLGFQPQTSAQPIALKGHAGLSQGLAVGATVAGWRRPATTWYASAGRIGWSALPSTERAGVITNRTRQRAGIQHRRSLACRFGIRGGRRLGDPGPGSAPAVRSLGTRGSPESIADSGLDGRMLGWRPSGATHFWNFDGPDAPVGPPGDGRRGSRGPVHDGRPRVGEG